VPEARTARQQDPAALEAQIERTREQLTGTVDALGARLDVRARARAALPVAGAAATALVALLLLRRRRRG
jgi:alpha-D-ribose 1-methylphosphonate 5-triphosphate synthase subunit PhnI